MEKARWFTPRELATWQRRELGGENYLRVELPAFQRGPAWRPHQTELLWDSLLRGFPIGSILLARYDPSRGRRRASTQDDSEREPQFHILDGQQRWNSITLGFLDIWRREGANLQTALWIDLKAPQDLPDGRRFVFRVVTRSHPWGYKRYDPSKRLTAIERREAFTAFDRAARAANKWQQDFRPGSLPVSLAWPWDAGVPVPVPLLIEAIGSGGDEDSICRKLESLLARLPYWVEHEGEPREVVGWRHDLRVLLQNRTPFMMDVVRSMQINLGLDEPALYRIPALIAPEEAPLSPREIGNNVREDPLATLFVRMNVAGTRPSDDELRFSILKSVCPDVQDVADQLGRMLMPPAKLVTLLSRLVLSREATEPPGEPDLARFRRLVHRQDDKCPDFLRSLRQYLGLDLDRDDGKPAGRAKQLIDAAVDLLGYGSWGLPAVSIVNLAATSKSTSFFFLLLVWLDRLTTLNAIGQKSPNFDEETRRLITGAVSYLAWFADRPGDCLYKLWTRLDQYSSPSQIERFFSEGMMAKLLASERRRLLMPALPPYCLGQVIRQAVNEAVGFNGGMDGVWTKQWSRYQSLDLEVVANTWLDDCKIPSEQRMYGLTLGLAAHLWGMKELLHYAQRQQIKSWFPGYDPSSPDQLEDTDRPWDYDHIFPGSYGQVNSLPSLVTEWFNSIGNLRVWPLEANRAGGDARPAKKLDTPICQETAAPYNLHNGVEIR